MTTTPPRRRPIAQPTLSLYRNRLGVYYVNVYFPDTKRRVRESLYTRSEAEANKLLEQYRQTRLPELLAENKATPNPESQTPNPDTSPRIRDLVQWFAEHMQHERLSPRTIQKYSQVLEDFEYHCRRNHVGRVQQLSFDVIASFTDRDDAKAIIRRWLRTAVDAGKLDTVPIRKWFIRPKRRHGARDSVALSPGELRTVLAIIDESAPTVAPIIRFMALTGTRPSDALDLRWSQVNLDERYARRVQIKTQNLATYSLCEAVCDLLRAQQSPAPSPTGHVFTNTAGRPFTYNVLYRTFTRALQRADFAVLRDGAEHTVDLKTLRHTYGTHMADLGCPMPQLQRQMGHERIETTMQYYHADHTAGLPWADRFQTAMLTPNQTPKRASPDSGQRSTDSV